MFPRDLNLTFRAVFAGALAVAAGAMVTACSPAKVSADGDLAALVQTVGRTEMSHSPEEADMMGVSVEAFGGPYASLLNERTMAAVERARTTRLDQLDQLEAIDRTALTRDSQRQLDSLLYVLRTTVAVDSHGYGYANLGWASPYLINPQDGAYTDLVKFMTRHSPVRSRADADAWLKRLDHIDEAMRDERRRFEVDMAAGATPPRAIIQRTLARVHALTPTSPREHPVTLFFIESLAQIPDLSEQDIAKLVDQAVKQVGGPIAAEYRALASDLDKALPKSAEAPGVWRLNGGEDYYRDALRLYTTTELTPKELHAAGEKLVADTTAQLEPLLLELGQEDGTVAQRLRALSVDPANLFPDTPEGQQALMDAVNVHVKWGETQQARIVTVGPKGKVELRQAPTISQDTAPGAYYRPATLDGSRPATFTLNLRSTLDFPMWTLPTLAYHEAAPGHHLQAGLAREKPDQPLVNLLISSPAYSEGWAVYAEDLADELGAYQADKLAKIGYLQSVLFRAARMVADTGIHSERWTREQAIDYLVNTTGMARPAIESEVDRYIVWPGLATSYMAGRETIQRLRKNAKTELGQRFDLKAFHDVILGQGPRPLPVLEQDIHDWVISRKPAAPVAPKAGAAKPAPAPAQKPS
jgi:uncharacterized protein (DUF885 family)